MNKNLYLDIHVLQTVPPSCVNRDDTGSPKTAVYGGVTRDRVSSQAWKRSMRLMFSDLLNEDQVGFRTKGIVDLVAEKIAAVDPAADCVDMAIEALKNAGLGIKSADKGTDALFFMSDHQAQALADLILNGETDKDLYKEALKDKPSIDMCLFGRMVASDPSLNYDAASQVAHAISTHAVQNEFDYFTAVDDCAAEGSAGAAHLGTTEFNSSTLYRYANINLRELGVHLSEEECAAAVSAFIKAFVCSMPTGKQNSFGNRTLPDMVYITLREDQPINLVNAFECPVVAGELGHAKTSAKKMLAYAGNIYSVFSCAPVKEFVLDNVNLDEIPEDRKSTFADLLTGVVDAVRPLIVSEVE